MNTSFFIAKRYLFSKKSRNAINIISAISVLGVTVVSAVLVITLSVFNGLYGLVESLFNSFDPDLRITATVGKHFVPSGPAFDSLRRLEGVASFAEVVEEEAMLSYGERRHICKLKGVDQEHARLSGIDTMLLSGSFRLRDEQGRPMAAVGAQVAMTLSLGTWGAQPLQVWAPSRTAPLGTLDGSRAFNSGVLYASSVFAIQQEYDSKYVLVPLDFARELLEYPVEATSCELLFAPGLDDAGRERVKREAIRLLGPGFAVRDRYEQHASLFRIMKQEKWAIYLILSFILAIASFNIIGSLTMLIIDKKQDIATLKSLGADERMVRRVFLLEGWMISLLGAVLGIGLGSFACWLQIRYGLIAFGQGFLVDAYPVELQGPDLLWVLGIVAGIGWAAAWYPARTLTRRYFETVSLTAK